MYIYIYIERERERDSKKYLNKEIKRKYTSDLVKF